MRSTRDEDDEIYRVEGDMNYKEWEEKFLKNGDKSDLTKIDDFENYKKNTLTGLGSGDKIEQRSKVGTDNDNSKGTSNLQSDKSNRGIDSSIDVQSLDSAKIKQNNLNMKDVDSIMGVKVGDTDEKKTTKVLSIREIDFKRDVDFLINEFAEKYRYADVEYAYVISPKGVVVELEGGTGNVNIELATFELLKDSLTIHNHPRVFDDIKPDSFSREDFGAFFLYHLKELYVVMENDINVVSCESVYFSIDEAFAIYDEVEKKVSEIAMNSQNYNMLDRRQLAILRYINDKFKELNFYE